MPDMYIAPDDTTGGIPAIGVMSMVGVIGDSWASLSWEHLTWLLRRDLRDDSVGGSAAWQWANQPTRWGGIANDDMRYVSIGTLDVIRGDSVADITRNMLTMFEFFLNHPEAPGKSGTRKIVHVGYNRTLPDPPAAAIAACEAEFEGRYLWLPMGHFHNYVAIDPKDPWGLHLRDSDYELRVGDALGRMIRRGWTP